MSQERNFVLPKSLEAIFADVTPAQVRLMKVAVLIPMMILNVTKIEWYIDSITYKRMCMFMVPKCAFRK